MTLATLVGRNLRWFWRTNLAVILGVAVAVTVLAGALLVGSSVRTSLRHLALERLGATDLVVAGPVFVREGLADELRQAAPEVAAAVPLIALDAVVAHGPSGRRAGTVHLYGVDDRFFEFHGRSDVAAPSGREALLSAALAAELGTARGDGLIARVQKPSAIPSGVLQGRRDDTSRAIRLTVADVLPADRLGDFALGPRQGPVRALFVPLDRLQRDLEQEDRANAILVAGARSIESAALVAAVDGALAARASAGDLGLRVRASPEPSEGVPQAAPAPAVIVESETGLVSGALARAIEEETGRLGYRSLPVLTYLANTIRIGDREIPYSVITAMDLGAYQKAHGEVEPASGTAEQGSNDTRSPMWLNEWAARELNAAPGDTAEIEYYLWSDERGLETRQATFTISGTVSMQTAGGDRTLTPTYPGITDAPRIGDWDPPFPVDLGRIRPADERYWDEYRAAPKAFIPLDTGQTLWPSPFGALTSVRLSAPPGTASGEARTAVLDALRRSWGPQAAGLSAQAMRQRALDAARGSTDFGEYFVYFSFFLVVSGLLLTALFFRLGVEQRAREIGLLQALGYRMAHVRRVLLAEAAALAVAGCVLGLAGAIGFGSLILYGLRTWWVGAVGTSALELHVSPAPLAMGGIGGVLMALGAIWWTLRALSRRTTRGLMSGATAAPVEPGSRLAGGMPRSLPLLLLAAALGLVVAARQDLLSNTPAFFGAGALLLAAALTAFSRWLRRPPGPVVHEPGAWALARLGARQGSWRPGRAVLSAALIASATFMIVSVGAFRRSAVEDPTSPTAGTGGFLVFAESLVPLMHDLASPAGREALGFGTGDESALDGVRIARFRLRPGDEGSCLNLYRPTAPRIVAPTDAFRREGRFTFAKSLAGTDAERQNPWLLLDRTFDDGAVPVIGDLNSLTYALHRGVGDDIVMPGPEGVPVTLRVVAALSDSIFQSELVISERQFVRLFPRHEGYRFFLIGSPAADSRVTALLEDRLADFGFDAQSTVERLASYHRVENTYLSTFQALGGLGLVLGTFGLGAVLLRNVLERRRELALLRAVGYRRRHLSAMVMAESLLLLATGLAAGTAAAALAVAPAMLTRGGEVPLASTALLLAAVLAAGLVSTLAATRAATSAPLLASLRSE
jgi:putative ABC transport system permease protein